MRAAHLPRRDTARLLASIATMAVVLVSILLIGAAVDRDGVTRAAARTIRRPGGQSALVTIASRAGTTAVPDAYLGLSTEYWALPVFERHSSLFEKVLALLHAQGDGPFVLRIGGDSADHTFWDPGARRLPPWVFQLTSAWLRRTATLVRQTGVKLILDLNLITDAPLTAARWAREADLNLPSGSVAGFEVGNEPDIYSRSYWRAETSRTSLFAGVLPHEISPITYGRDFQSYARALSRAAPGVPLLGPALANPYVDVNWIASLLAGPHPGLGAVSAHRYPLSACVSPSSRSYPTIARLLRNRTTTLMAQSLVPAAQLAHRAGLPFRLTELNSVTCGGRPGVSDAFATALWAPDALFELLQAGVDGVNVHVRAGTINAPFALTDGGLDARPFLYGLILFARTLGPDGQLVAVRVDATPGLHLKAWAVRVSPGGLHVLLIDKSAQSANVDLRLPAAGPATVQRLLAPSAASRTGVTLDGQWLGRDGDWYGRPADQIVRPGATGYKVWIRGPSAALLSVRLQPEPPASAAAPRPAEPGAPILVAERVL